MTQQDPHHPSAEPILDRLHRLMSTVTVFGDPIERDGLTVIPAVRMTAGGGGGEGVDQEADREGDGGGAGLIARPVGAFIINDGRVTWKPTVTIETVATLLILAVTWLARRKRAQPKAGFKQRVGNPMRPSSRPVLIYADG